MKLPALFSAIIFISSTHLMMQSSANADSCKSCQNACGAKAKRGVGGCGR